MPVVIEPGLINMTLAQWREYGAKLKRGADPPSAEQVAFQAALVERAKALLHSDNKKIAEAAADFLTSVDPASRRPEPGSLIVPGVLSERDWVKAASKHAAFLEKLRRDYESGE